MARAKHKRRARGWKIAAASLGVLALLGGGTAYAAYRYDASSADVILPGISVAGVDVGQMTWDEAVRTLRAEAELTLSDDVVVRAAGFSWTMTPASLGMTADVDAAVTKAFAVADDLSLLSRLNHRLRDVPVGVSLALSYTPDPASVEAFVQQAYDEVAVPAVDARFSLVDDELVTRRSQDGRELKVQLATTKILTALSRRVDEVDIPVKTVEPEVPTASLGQTIVVDVSDNRLWLYEGLKVVKEYGVATGTASYPTPVGTFEIVDKRENPTWYNPAPDGWGADLPLSIGPGPGNPLGTRAMYLNAPGIRIHGTWSSSSIGTAASHGCIRMHISDSEELYPMVEMGTTVIVKP